MYMKLLNMKLFGDDVKLYRIIAILLILSYLGLFCNHQIVCKKPATWAEKEPDYTIGDRAEPYRPRNDLHRESKKGCHPVHGYNFVNCWSICKILSLLQRAVNFQQNPY